MSEPTGVVLHDHDRDTLVVVTEVLMVEHEGRRRELRLRVARGVIRDVVADSDLPSMLGEPEPLL